MLPFGASASGKLDPMTLAHMLARFRDAMAGEQNAQTEAPRRPAPARRPPPVPSLPPAGAWQGGARAARPEPSEMTRKRIRDHYLAVRFPGAPHTEEDLRDSTGVIKSARLYFEDGDVERACELLEFAVDVNRADEALWLAHLEILFLKHNGAAFADVARRFHEHFPASGRWPEILRLGLRLAPDDPLFHGARPREADIDEHYGAWPQVQNWIQAPFDLTGDVLAAEFHARMRGGDVAAPISAKASGT
jgi:hypothetical protein